MFKVVIADDEARICRLVRMLADWDALDMEVVGTAANGLEALSLVESLMPDILITDIRMPGCDGLELIEKVRRFVPKLEIIIISGYAEFEYAQTAIRYNVCGYLLKPIKKQMLMATLEKARENCRDRNTSKMAIEDLRRDSKRSQALLRERLVEDLFVKHLDAPTREQLRDDFGFPVYDGSLLPFIVKIDYDPNAIADYSLSMIQNRVEEVCKTNILPLCLSGMLQFHDSWGYGLLNYAPQKHDEIRRALRHFLNLLEVQKSFFGSMEFSLAIGSETKSVDALPTSIRKACLAICERLLEGTGRLLESVPQSHSPKPKELLTVYQRSIHRAVDSLDATQADNAADALRHEALQCPDIRGYELFDLVLSAARIFVPQIGADDATLLRAFTQRCELCGSAETLFLCLRDFQRQQIERVGARQENEAIRPIRIAKQYIQSHFHEPITLDDVCAATGFSVSYFSTLFKKETGEGFSKYLTRVRIEQAKTLLQTTNLSISEICARVGYNDLKHFTHTFKRLTSLNPGQYRKLYG